MVNFEEYNWDYTDECLLSKFKEKIAAVKKRTGNLSITTLEDYYALPLIPTYDTRGFYIGGLCSEKGSLHSSSKVLPVRVFNSYCFNPENAIYDDREVIFAGCFWLHWEHFILEQVSRLYYFLNEKDSSLPIIYLADRPLTGNFLEFFDLLGIDTSRLIWVNKITKFRKIIIPEVSVVTRDYWYEEYKQIFEKINTRNFLKTYAFENLKLLFKNPNAFNVAMPYKIFDYYYNILKKENIFYLDIKFAGKLVELFYKTKNLKRKYRFLKTIIVSKCLIKGINLEKF